MDPAHFDHIAIRLSRRATRRGTLSGMAAAASFLFAALKQSVGAQTALFHGVPLGGACTDTNECAQVQGCNVPGPVSCGDNGVVEDGTLTCCLPEGGFCFAAADCCAGLDCVSRDGDTCGAGRCEVIPLESASEGCETYMASMLAQLPPSSAYSILSTWGQRTPDLFVLPAHCPWPALPPESPWCTPDYCTELIPLEHSEDGLEYCYWYDPELDNVPENLDEDSRRRAKWRCGSLDVIASTP